MRGKNNPTRALAARVPANGLRIEAFPEIPPGAPMWNSRVQVIPKQKDWDYEVITNALTTACQEGSLVNLFFFGVRSNMGRDDGKQLGATSRSIIPRREGTSTRRESTRADGDRHRHFPSSPSRSLRHAHLLPRKSNNKAGKPCNDFITIRRCNKQSAGYLPARQPRRVHLFL